MISAYERKYSLSPRRTRAPPVVDGKQEDDVDDEQDREHDT